VQIKILVLKSAGIQEMSGRDLQGLVGGEKFASIKSRDRHPFFVELLVAHEGISRGKILPAAGNSNSRGAGKFWSRDRIEELAGRLNSKPVPVYLFHDRANRPRKKVGEIISTLTSQVLGRLCALAYAYISDPEVREMIRNKELDTCSLEADLVFEKNGDNSGFCEWVVNAVETVSGLALGSKKISRPGFPGAAILAQAEEFEDAGGGFEETEQMRKRAERELKAKEEELAALKAELAGLRDEKAKDERMRRVAVMVGKEISERNLRREERELLLEQVSEHIELKPPDETQLERAVKEELQRELGRLAELRRLYQRPAPAPAPLEPGENVTKNPLIPKN
jgi:hypothetical protein